MSLFRQISPSPARRMAPVPAARIAARIAALTCAFMVCAPALAQYVWLDEKGTKQYSDQPPPVNVPKNRILKAPGLKKTEAPAATAATAGSASAEAGSDSSASAASSSSKASAPPTIAERNAEYQKRKKEQAEKDKKAEEESQQAQTRKRDCDRLRGYERTLTEGGRISQTDKNGEKVVLDDKQIGRELAEVRKNLADCK